MIRRRSFLTGGLAALLPLWGGTALADKPPPTRRPIRGRGMLNAAEAPYWGNIQQAVTAALAQGDGRVYVPPGQYVLDPMAGLVIARNQPQDQQHGLELFGAGLDTKLLYAGAGHAVTIRDPQMACPGGIEIHHLKIKCTNTTAQSGVCLNPGGTGLTPQDVELHHLWIDGTGGQSIAGVRVTRTGYGLKVHDNTIDDCFDGVVLGGLCNWVSVRDNHILLFRRYGITAGASVVEWAIGGLEIAHNRIEGTRAWATLQNPAVAIRLSHVTGAEVAKNRVEQTPGNPLTGLLLDVNARRNEIRANTLHVVTPYSIDVEESADRNTLWNNEIGDPRAPMRIRNNNTVIYEPKSGIYPW